MIDKKKIRDTLRFVSSLFFGWLYIPHIAMGGVMRW